MVFLDLYVLHSSVSLPPIPSTTVVSSHSILAFLIYSVQGTMRSSVLLLSTLAGSALALPGVFPRGFNTTSPSHSATHSHTLLPTGGGGGEKPTETGKGGESQTTTAPGGSGSVPGTTVTSTITDTITKTTFKPCSTPVHTEGGTTYYSSWVTASTYETTTCYTTTTVLTSTPTAAPTAPAETTVAPAPSGGHGSETCPPASTVTVYVTVGNGGSGATNTVAPGGQGGHHCERCETITYTNTQGYTTTIVIPPIAEPTGTETEKTTTTEVPSTTETNKPTGTGSHPTHTKPTGTGNGPAPTETKTWHGGAHSGVRN
ncbi:unnamed protein product [Aspergillus oryzae RIB40]|uniref:DNA, SC138 n=2 Tax=Aspergillus subgen. Circumdati TaxID=2720871 RepID=Q2U1X7_ASPOR|nr:unnamed protein product [Aspergillus oryzae RIB40]BAE64438.1 unnamed protein product [Aspergillus oryzae RIB40]